jgi:tRNA (cmo5U34)-methyltransferase
MAELSIQEIGMSKRITDYQGLRESIPDIVSEKISSPDSWLDTGCGMGGSVRASFERFPGTRFVLADPSSENIAEARKNIQGAEFVIAPTDGLTMPDASFDVITAILSHHYYSQREKKMDAVRNCRRMLREGGMFITVEHTRYDGDQSAKDSEWRDYMESKGLEERFIAEMFQRRGTVYFPMTEEEHLSMLEEAGFRDAKVFWRTCSDIGIYAFRRCHGKSIPALSTVGKHQITISGSATHDLLLLRNRQLQACRGDHSSRREGFRRIHRGIGSRGPEGRERVRTGFPRLLLGPPDHSGEVPQAGPHG